jgi:Spy/CpxP family protein refolding chaperone
MNGGRGRAALVIAAIVVGSALAGAAADRMFLARGHGGRGGSSRSASNGGNDARRRAEMLDRMTRDLNLSTAQRSGIDSVMQRTDSALRAVRGEMQPRLRQIFDSSRAQIASRLDSTQRAKFARLPAPKRGRR